MAAAQNLEQFQPFPPGCLLARRLLDCGQSMTTAAAGVPRPVLAEAQERLVVPFSLYPGARAAVVTHRSWITHS
jgi:hypothetical protein